jgi:putative salt-induced outer membrane protein YdiY
MRIVSLALVGLAGAMASAPMASAQVIQPAPTVYRGAPAEPAPLWSGQFDASLLMATGNSDTRALGVGGVAFYNRVPWHLEGKASFTSASSEGIATARRLLSSLRLERDLGSWWGVYGGVGYARDTFAGYTGQTTIEGGALYRAIVQPKHLLTLTAGLAQTFEQRLVPPDENFLGGKAGLNYRFRISENAEFVEEAGMLWNFEVASDWRFVNTAALTAQVTKTIGIKLANDLFYRHAPIAGFETTDSVLRAGIVAKF